MRLKVEKIQQSKNYYESDDGCFWSYDANEVKEYESIIERGKPDLILRTLNDDEFLNGYHIYKCNDKVDYLTMISNIAKEGYIDRNNILRASNLYNPQNKYYAVKLRIARGDAQDELVVRSINSLVTDYDDTISALEEELADLKAERKSLTELDYDEDAHLSVWSV